MSDDVEQSVADETEPTANGQAGDETTPTGRSGADGPDHNPADHNPVDKPADSSLDGADELPEDLQPHLVDPEDYVFPNNNRRRVPGYLYLIVAVALCVLVLVGSDSSFVNGGLLFAAAVLGAFGIYSIVSGWNLAVDERDALVAAVAEVGFPVGHASAQMGWRGLLSRPTWRMLIYSADEPPTKRGFVMVDGVDGSIVNSFVEDNPEDWSEHYAVEDAAEDVA